MRNIPQVEVLTTVRFSEMEKAIIRRRRLRDFIVLKRMPDTLYMRRRELLGLKVPKEGFELQVRDLLDRTDRHLCDTPVHATAYVRALRRALVKLKVFIDENAGLRLVAHYRL